MKANDFYDAEELEWWRHFRAKCFNHIPVLCPLLGDRFRVQIQNPFDETWEDVWVPKSQSADTSTAEIPQLGQERSEGQSGSPPTPG